MSNAHLTKEMLDSEIFVATIAPSAEFRSAQWKEFFGAAFVPVLTDVPCETLLPDGRSEACYFVDFALGGQKIRDRLLVGLARSIKGKNAPGALEMVKSGVYPLLAQDVTVVRGPRRIWGA